jgi:hypothetical protein
MFRIGDRETVIATPVDTHVEALGHVAINALCAGRGGRVAMMVTAIEYRGLVALRAKRVTFGEGFAGMRVMAIGAGHAALLHFTLQKRTQYKDLVVDLTVTEVQSWFEQCEAVVIVVGRLGCDIAERTTPRVTATASIDVIVVQGSGGGGDVVIAAKGPGQSRFYRFVEPARIIQAASSSEFNMSCGRTMAGFTADAGFLPGCSVTPRLRIVVFPEIGAVALDTSAIRILKVSGPEKRMVRINLFFVLQVIPTLPALVDFTAIPGNIQRL